MVTQRLPADALVPQRECLRSGQYPPVSRRFQLGGLRGVSLGLLQEPTEGVGPHVGKVSGQSFGWSLHLQLSPDVGQTSSTWFSCRTDSKVFI